MKVAYKGTLFYDGQSALVVKRWLHRVDDDDSRLTFEEWDPTSDVDHTLPPAVMIINSSELRGAGFNLKEVLPPELEATVEIVLIVCVNAGASARLYLRCATCRQEASGRQEFGCQR